jgi:hypothetical protein
MACRFLFSMLLFIVCVRLLSGLRVSHFVVSGASLLHMSVKKGARPVVDGGRGQAPVHAIDALAARLFTKQ